ncbi:MAG: DNA polymerase III subunit delta [Candidatus Berkelbacteria bacterium]|nr:DNA polymerase III subunit delta [Candidatus Berkelbacteria bacterium]
MLALFYGEDQYSLNQELKKIESQFALENFGDLNISKFDGENLSYENFLRSASAMPFLADKRLIIIKNFLSSGDQKLREYFAENLEKLPKSVEIILAENGDFNKNLGLFKKLQKSKSAVNFSLRQGFELEKWLVESAKSKKIPLSTSAAKKLIATAGNNSSRLLNELEKLDLFRLAAGKDQIGESDIEQMVAGENTSNVFDFIDALGVGNSRLAVRNFQKLIADGKNENYILTMIIFQFRNMLIIEDLIVRGVKRQNIAGEANLHPFVAGKTLKILENFDLPTLKRIYYRLSQVDIDIKTGHVEPKLALEHLLAELTL